MNMKKHQYPSFHISTQRKTTTILITPPCAPDPAATPARAPFAAAVMCAHMGALGKFGLGRRFVFELATN